MALTTAQIQNAYVAFFNRPADVAGLQYWSNYAGNSADLLNTFAQSAEYTGLYANMNATQLVSAVYQNLFGRAPEVSGLTYWVNQLDNGALKIGNIAEAINKGAQGTDSAIITNKVAAATAFTAALDTTPEIVAYASANSTALSAVKSWLNTVTSDVASVTTATGAALNTVLATVQNNSNQNVGQTFTLTTGADNFTGTSGNDTFVAADVAAGRVLTVGDTLNGGMGNDTLNLTTAGAVTAPVGATISSIETVNVLTNSTVDLNTTSWAGLTALNVTGVNGAAAAGLTAATTTAVNVTDSALAGGNVLINGGSNVSVTATDASAVAGVINVGGTTAAAGDVNIITNTSLTDVAGATGGAGDVITVTGGKTVTVTQNLTSASSDNVGDTLTGGSITVNGNATTTGVTVNQTAAKAQVTTATGVIGSAAIVAGAVTVNDVNQATATADTITSVSLNGYGASSVVNSDALATLNLSRTGGTLTVNGGAADATQTATTLAMNVNGLTGAAIGLSTPYTTLNIDSKTAASTIANVTAAGVTTLNVSGDAAVTLTNNTFGALTNVVSTNTAGVTLGTTALGANVSFTGGAGNDSIILSNAFTKAITMGDGNDTVTYGGAASTAAGLVGSVAAGNGTDTIKMTAAQADVADGSAAFNTAFTGFEVLDIATGATDTTVNLAGINGVNSVVTRGVTAANTLTLNGFTTGGSLTLDGVVAGTIAANVNNAVLNAGDVFNIKLSNNGVATNFGTVTAAGVETLNISTVDAGTTTALKAATQDLLTLGADAQATKVVVSGNNGLAITNNAANTAITSFDASGVKGDDASTIDTAANLGVTFASVNATATAAVSIIGGEGNDTLTGNAAIDTITGGAGNDIVSGGLGADIINVGVGRDVISIASTAGASSDSSTAASDTVKGFNLSSAITTATNFIGTGANAGSAADVAAAFQSSTAGGANFSLLSLDIDAAAADLPLNVEANVTAQAGQAAGVTYTVKDGILTLGGAGAATVDTLGEWLAEAQAVASTAGDILAFQFGNNTYVFAENGAQDVLVNLEGVTGATSLIEITGTTTAAAGSILFADIA